jgi:hypothetical protein
MLYERSLKSTIGAETAASGEGSGLWGMNISVRRQTSADVGGYDEGLRRSQDLDFGLRVVAAGVPLVFEPPGPLPASSALYRTGKRLRAHIRPRRVVWRCQYSASRR